MSGSFFICKCSVDQLASRLVSIALKWFGPEGGDPEDYSGGRELDDFAKLYVFDSFLRSEKHSAANFYLLITFAIFLA